MAGALFLLLIVLPIAELWVIVQFAQEIGVLQTIGLLIVVSIAGAFLLKQQGMATWRRMQATLARGEMPGREMTDAFLVMLGGALLLTPGFITDVVGILLLLPPTRAALKGVFRKVLRSFVVRRTGQAGRIYNATVVRGGRRNGASTPPSVTPTLPPNAGGGDLRAGEPGSSGDSPDRG